MSNEESTNKKKLKVGLFDYLFLLLLLIGVVTVSIITFSNTSRTQPTPSNSETYTVEFDVNIKDAQIESLKVNEGGLVTKPEDPSKEGYTFGGWYRDEACEYKWDFSKDKVTGNTTLYPKWTLNTYTISFNMQDHGTKIDSQTVEYNGSVTKPTDPTEAGYTFGGWFKEKTCENAWSFAENKVTANTTLYAKWTINSFTVTFNMNEHGTQVEPLTVNYGGHITEPTAPTASGYTFGGWYRDEGLNFKWDFENNAVNSNTTLYAKWTANPVVASYTVSFNLNGHGSAIDSQEVTEGDTVDEPTNPAGVEHYTFSGWYKDVDCEYKWDFTNDKVNAETTLYAKWTPKTYTVTFNLNPDSIPGSAKTEDQNMYNYDYDGKCPKPIYATYGSKIRRPYYDEPEVEAPNNDVLFEGWYKDSAKSEPWDWDNDVVTGNITIWAGWLQSK